MGVSIQQVPFSSESTISKMRASNLSIGAVVTFTGFVRDLYDNNDLKKLEQLELEHYAGMTEKMLSLIESEANKRWPLEAIEIVHRVGILMPGEPIVLVAVASKHRHDAFEACQFIIDYLKVEAPFWKKEKTNEGGYWVNELEEDREKKYLWDSLK